MVQYCKDIWPQKPYLLASLAAVASEFKDIKVLWDENVEVRFKHINKMVSIKCLIYIPWVGF